MIGQARDDGKIVLATSTWVSLLVVVATAVAANLGLIYTQSERQHQFMRTQSINLQDRIDRLDEKWQERTMMMAETIQKDIKRVEDKIPPDWFRSMVDRNTARLDKLEDDFHNQKQ